MNTASRSNTSTAGSVASPWISTRHADPLHPLEHRTQSRDIGHAVMRIGGGARRIELGGDPHFLGNSPSRSRRATL